MGNKEYRKKIQREIENSKKEIERIFQSMQESVEKLLNQKYTTAYKVSALSLIAKKTSRSFQSALTEEARIEALEAALQELEEN